MRKALCVAEHADLCAHCSWSAALCSTAPASAHASFRLSPSSALTRLNSSTLKSPSVAFATKLSCSLLLARACNPSFSAISLHTASACTWGGPRTETPLLLLPWLHTASPAAARKRNTTRSAASTVSALPLKELAFLLKVYGSCDDCSTDSNILFFSPASVLNSSACRGGSMRNFFNGRDPDPSVSSTPDAAWVSPATPFACSPGTAAPVASGGVAGTTWDAGMGSSGTLSAWGASIDCKLAKSTALPSNRSFTPRQSLRMPILHVFLNAICSVSVVLGNVVQRVLCC
eukprot:9504157-Pyramimonas_sp.AAC.2